MRIMGLSGFDVDLYTLAKSKKEISTQIYADVSPPLQAGEKNIYVMYVYDCNVILITAMKNRSDKEIIRASQY